MNRLQRQVLGLDEQLHDLQAYVQGERTFLLHQAMWDDWQRLRHSAKQAGFDLAIVSSYRDFARQKKIWQEKASGQRALLDVHGKPLCFAQLSKAELLHAILQWSAVPGCSRHHWGCDIDVFDAKAMRITDVQLLPREVEGDGACAPLHIWLDERITKNESFGFFRPYDGLACKVASEKWHLSYAPVALRLQDVLSPTLMVQVWREQRLLLLKELEESVQWIYQDYVQINKKFLPDWLNKVNL